MTLAVPYAYRLERLDPGDLPGEVVEARRRAAAVAVASACAGLSWASDPERYRALLFPHDEPAKARAMARSMSSCALFALAVLRLLGADHPHLAAPYARRLGRAVSDVLAVGGDLGVLRTPSAGLAPAPGDVVLIGQNGAPRAWCRGTGAGEHILVVTAAGGGPVDSVDGGQGPGGTAVARRSRRFVRAGDELWLASPASGLDPDGRPSMGRRAVGWLDVGALPTARPAMVPAEASLDP